MRELAEDRPFLLAVDDLHWADEASLELLAYLSRRVQGRVLIVATYRPDELRERPPLRRSLSDVVRERRWDIELQPLTATDASRALRLILGPTRMSAATRELLHARSGGNPLLLEEILRALASRGDLERGDGGWRLRDPRGIPLPATVRDAVAERYRALDATGREIVGVAAIIGERFGYDLLREVSGRDEGELRASLRAGLDAQLLVELEAGTFGFRHTLTRDAVLDGMPSFDRQAVHRRIAAIIERDPDPDSLATIAAHWDAAGEADRASRAHESAAERALQRNAFADALRHLQRAVELAPHDDARVARLQYDVGRFAFLLHRIPIALSAARDSVRCQERLGDRRGIARALALEAFAAWLLGGTATSRRASRCPFAQPKATSTPSAPSLGSRPARRSRCGWRNASSRDRIEQDVDLARLDRGRRT